MKADTAVIGGSGLYEIPGVKVVEEADIATPFGPPSDRISFCEIAGTAVAFLPRHGRGHRLLPTQVPSRANIWALKSLGVEQIIAVSAVGSLQEEYEPGHFAVCDQLIDRTRNRRDSFFGDGVVGHVGFADPYCPRMRRALLQVMERHGHPHHAGGTLICMEGPPFSTRAESHLYRSWGAHMVGMTALPEAKLAREAEICFVLVAMITDYDCWREAGEDVTLEMVLQVMRKNGEAIRSMIPDFVSALHRPGECRCRSAARNAILTEPRLIPEETRRRLSLFYGKYWQ